MALQVERVERKVLQRIPAILQANHPLSCRRLLSYQHRLLELKFGMATLTAHPVDMQDPRALMILSAGNIGSESFPSVASRTEAQAPGALLQLALPVPGFSFLHFGDRLCLSCPSNPSTPSSMSGCQHVTSKISTLDTSNTVNPPAAAR